MDPVGKLLYVQPVLTGYRLPVIDALRAAFELKIAADPADHRLGHPEVDVPELDPTSTVKIFGGKLLFQHRLFTQIARFRPDAVLIFGNVRYLSLWSTLILCRVLRIRCWVHGQGLYRYPRVSLFRAFIYRCAVALSTGYICYTELSRKTLLRIKCPTKKLYVALNSLSLPFLVQPGEKSFSEEGILFVGRLRAGVELELLLDAVKQLRSEGLDIVVHVIGDGPARVNLQKIYNGPGVKWYGAMHDSEAITAVSRRCRVGCYPGAAGLSVVHFFSLSLPPIVDSYMPRHMGPEPSYVEDGINGFTFSSSMQNDLAVVLRQVWSLDCEQMRRVSESAYRHYLDLNRPSLGHRLVELLRSGA